MIENKENAWTSPPLDLTHVLHKKISIELLLLQMVRFSLNNLSYSSAHYNASYMICQNNSQMVDDW